LGQPWHRPGQGGSKSAAQQSGRPAAIRPAQPSSAFGGPAPGAAWGPGSARPGCPLKHLEHADSVTTKPPTTFQRGQGRRRGCRGRPRRFPVGASPMIGPSRARPGTMAVDGVGPRHQAGCAGCSGTLETTLDPRRRPAQDEDGSGSPTIPVVEPGHRSQKAHAITTALLVWPPADPAGPTRPGPTRPPVPADPPAQHLPLAAGRQRRRRHVARTWAGPRFSSSQSGREGAPLRGP